MDVIPEMSCCSGYTLVSFFLSVVAVNGEKMSVSASASLYWFCFVKYAAICFDLFWLFDPVPRTQPGRLPFVTGVERLDHVALQVGKFIIFFPLSFDHFCRFVVNFSEWFLLFICFLIWFFHSRWLAWHCLYPFFLFAVDVFFSFYFTTDWLSRDCPRWQQLQRCLVLSML